MQSKKVTTYGYSEVTVNGLKVYSFKTAVKDNDRNKLILNAKNIKFIESSRRSKKGKLTNTLNIEYATIQPIEIKYYSKRLGEALLTIATNNVLERYQWINSI